MSARYQKQFTIPDGFPHLLKTFTREILRSQPENIYEFGARYFTQLCEQRDAELEAEAAGQGESRSIYDIDPEDLQDFILDIFLTYDADGNGYLDRKEFKACLQSSTMGFSKNDIRQIMAEADENDDGVLEYKEFMPIMVQLIGSLKAKAASEQERKEEAMQAREAVEVQLLRGMSREQLEGFFASMFAQADTDGSGSLSRAEFKAALKNEDLGLTKKDINLLLSECDVDGDGCISYNEFVPLCWEILVQRFTDVVLQERSLQSNDTLCQFLIDTFAMEDSDGTNKLHVSKIKSALTQASQDVLGLTKLQILSIMSEAMPDAMSMVDYVKFAKPASSMIYSMVDTSSQEQRAQAMNMMSDTEAAQLLRGMSQETIESVMLAAFKEADVDASGTLDADEMRQVIMAFGAGELNLTGREIASLIAAVDTDESGTVTYTELVTYLTQVLNHLAREEYVQEVAFNNALA